MCSTMQEQQANYSIFTDLHDKFFPKFMTPHATMSAVFATTRTILPSQMIILRRKVEKRKTIFDIRDDFSDTLEENFDLNDAQIQAVLCEYGLQDQGNSSDFVVAYELPTVLTTGPFRGKSLMK